MGERWNRVDALGYAGAERTGTLMFLNERWVL